MSEPITTQEGRDEATRKLLRGLAHDTFMLGVDWVLDIILKSKEGQAEELRKEIKARAERQWILRQ
jgi:uncharacterized hydantoinase/oxoprolinase family protein